MLSLSSRAISLRRPPTPFTSSTCSIKSSEYRVSHSRRGTNTRASTGSTEIRRRPSSSSRTVATPDSCSSVTSPGTAIPPRVDLLLRSDSEPSPAWRNTAHPHAVQPPAESQLALAASASPCGGGVTPSLYFVACFGGRIVLSRLPCAEAREGEEGALSRLFSLAAGQGFEPQLPDPELTEAAWRGLADVGVSCRFAGLFYGQRTRNRMAPRVARRRLSHVCPTPSPAMATTAEGAGRRRRG
jgi:hypothetical protein